MLNVDLIILCWFISESGRLISDVIEMYNILDIRTYLVTMDIEKEFESLDNDFLLSVLKKNWFWWEFHLLDKSIIKWSTIMRYKWRIYNSIFPFRERCTPGWFHISILALEVLFELIKNNADIRRITIFNQCFFVHCHRGWFNFFS